MSWMVGMPNLGHTMEEGKVAEWLKHPGEAVRKGEVIAVVESDKASFDIESPADGVVARIDAPAQTVVAVGAAIGWITAPGESLQLPGDPRAAPAPAATEPGAAAAAPAAAAGTRERAGSARGRISPAARALAEGAGLDWETIAGSGDGGMITRDDVREAIAAAQCASASEGASAAAAASVAQAPAGPGTSHAAAASAMRRAIAHATRQAWTTIPHVPLQATAEVDALLARYPGELTAAIVRASALALQEHPSLNGWYLEQDFQPAGGSHVAVAVATPGGLLMPVLKDAQALPVARVQEDLARLAQQAREGRLDGAALLGGSFAVSTLGRWGVDAFAPIIAAPQVAILGVGRVARVPREAPDGGIRFASAITLTLVFDHRANDGVEAARCLAAIVARLEQPERL